MGIHFIEAHAIANIAVTCKNIQPVLILTRGCMWVTNMEKTASGHHKSKIEGGDRNESRTRALGWLGMTQPGLVAELGIWLGQRLPKRH